MKASIFSAFRRGNGHDTADSPATSRVGAWWWLVLGVPMVSLVAMAALALWSLTATPASSGNLLIGLIVALCLLGLIAIAAGTWLARERLTRPMHEIYNWTLKLNNGLLDTRLPANLPSEFEQLGNELNRIGERYQALDTDMHTQVQAQTQHISQKTRSLEIIYDVAASINVSRDLDDLLTRFLHTLREVVNARAAVVRLVTDDNQMRLVASTGLDDEVIEREQLLPAKSCLCGSAYEQGTVLFQRDLKQCDKIIGHSFFDDDGVAMIAVPLQYRGNTLGVYNLFVDEAALPECEEIKDLLTSIGRHLGMAIDKARLDDETNRLSIMKERTRIAHELHDSLAQTLASLRFQVRVLDENLRMGAEPAVWHELERIENNLDEAYAELRELITHFRAPIDKRGLVPGVEHLVERFRNQTGVHTFLQKEWDVVNLASHIEVEVLRIVQEALNNIRKHSQAHTVRVILRSKLNDQCEIIIEDDGVGIDDEAPDENDREHYGLHIMSERAKRINGKLRIESEPGEGTRISLSFPHGNTTAAEEHPVKLDIPLGQVGS